MEIEKDKILGIDTSNYTTSIAITHKNNQIISDIRAKLVVKPGGRGLRQSEGVFQHMANMPALIEQAFSIVAGNELAGIAVSCYPRPIENSYMPVFKVGENFGKSLATALNIPLLRFSHQEGHLTASIHGTSLSPERPYLAFHLSGGTSELLKMDKKSHDIIGGTKDISFGQLIDRIGVAMNMTFPTGEKMDRLALSYIDSMESCKKKLTPSFTKIKNHGLWVNLSGLETQFLRHLKGINAELSDDEKANFSFSLFSAIGDCLITLTEESRETHGIKTILFTGGVSASSFVRKKLAEHFKDKNMEIHFGNPLLSSDNAVGIALLGGKTLWP
ncbi:MAG: O-sialoglycoprotein endopeptidase [Anaerovoracaceae bacterium]|jgi:N6-L-threonylcarbamoyladenine synthase